MYEINIENVSKFGSTMKMRVQLNNSDRHFDNTRVSAITLLYKVRFSIKYLFIEKGKKHTFWFFIKLLTDNSEEKFSVHLSSMELGFKDKYLPADSNWHLITDGNFVFCNNFDLCLTEQKDNNLKLLNLLYDDEDLTDFELQGDDCSVRVHKSVLAASSPVLKTMLQGEWKETEKGCVLFKEMTKKDLDDLKKFIYLNSFPEIISDEFLKVTMRYLMIDMENIKTLIQNVKPENVYNILKYAMSENNDELSMMILECIQINLIKVDQIKSQVLNKKN